jgi:ABC-type Na+ efflux pump permease subunit
VLGPIFLREWATVPRRPGHYLARAVSLGLIWILGLTTWQATVGFARTPTLGETARFGLLYFQLLAYLLLTVLLFFSALSAANTVAREKERRTFVLLLLTDMRDYEIVLGKLVGSLLPIALLILGVVPIFFLLLLLGGVDADQIVQTLVVLTAAAAAAGSLGGLVALWRDRTFQALALAVLLVVLYLCVARLLGAVWPDGHAWLDPFAALASAVEPPTSAELMPLFAPAYGFAGVMLGLCIVLNGIGIWRLRVWNPKGEPIIQAEKSAATDDVAERAKAYAEADDDTDKRLAAHAAPGRVRAVWANPILWREIVTLAYGRRPLLVKLAYALVVGLICYAALAPTFVPGYRDPFVVTYGLVPVAVLSMLLVAAQAVTAITSERDGGQLDLLLVTDLTPGEFVFGKIGGILWNAKEFLLPPLLLTGVYAGLGLLATPPRNYPELSASMNATAFLAVAGACALLLVFALGLGVHVALRQSNSQVAVTHTLGTVFFLSVGTLVSIYLILINSNFESQWVSFVLFVAIGVGGLMYVLNADRPSQALITASVLTPAALFYCVLNVLIGTPGSQETAEPIVPFLVLAGTLGFSLSAMLVPLLSEFDVALGRTQREE